MSDPSRLEWLSPTVLLNKYNTTLRTSTEVTSVDIAQKVVVVGGSERVPYETLVLATGGVSRKLPIEGKDLSNVFTLRGVDDAKKIDAGMYKFFVVRIAHSNTVLV